MRNSPNVTPSQSRVYACDRRSSALMRFFCCHFLHPVALDSAAPLTLCCRRLNMKTAALVMLSVVSALAAAERSLPGTQPFDSTNDLSREMVAGIDQFLMLETAASVAGRSNYWRRD